MAADANSGYFIGENGTTIIPAPTDAWSGPYGGVFAGVGAFTGRVMDWDYYSNYYPEGDVDLSDISGLAGAQAGWNWRHGNALFGIAADWAWTDFDQSRFMNGGNQYGLARMDWLATLRGRIGVVAGNAMAYATGGLAAARVKHCANADNGPCSNLSNEDFGWDGTEFGLAAGAGVETRLDENWSLKAEYLFAGFGDRNVRLDPSSHVSVSDWSHQVRLGLNFHPGGLPYAEPLDGEAAWNGFYGGVHAGIGHFTGGAIQWGTTGPLNTLAGDADLGAFSAIGGVQAGHNWRSGNTLFGVEADLARTGYSEDGRYTASVTSDEYVRAEMDWLATLRGRLGAVAGNGMAYVTGGLALAHQNHCANRDLICQSDNEDDIAWDGWTLGLAAGAGVEGRLTDNWSLKAEYLFVRMLPETVVHDSVNDNEIDFQNYSHQFRVGLNYHLNGLPYEQKDNGGSWQGIYAGLHGGGGLITGTAFDWTRGVFSSPNGDLDLNGLAGLGGVQAGRNWQNGNIVYGLEADWAWTGFSEDEIVEGASYVQAEMDWLATLRGRLGVANGNAMFYATAGLALADLHHCGSLQVEYCETNNENAVEWDGLKLGLAAGAGAEIRLDDNWSVKGEYLFVQMDKESVVYDTDEGYEIDFSNRSHLFRVGLNYRIGG